MPRKEREYEFKISGKDDFANKFKVFIKKLIAGDVDRVVLIYECKNSEIINITLTKVAVEDRYWAFSIHIFRRYIITYDDFVGQEYLDSLWSYTFTFNSNKIFTIDSSEPSHKFEWTLWLNYPSSYERRILADLKAEYGEAPYIDCVKDHFVSHGFTE